MSTLLSVVIPAHNEEGSLPITVPAISTALRAASIPHEIVVVDDHSKDGTWAVLQDLGQRIPELRPIKNTGAGGFGHAIHFGLQHYTGDRVTIMMADLSDPPEDLVRFHHVMEEQQVDCVFGSRAMKGAQVQGYPKGKWIMNRLANWFLCIMFQYRYNDTTNPFKLYRRSIMAKVLPLRSTGFELEVEIPLKAMLRGARYTVVPNSWNGRTEGESKMKLGGLFGPYLRVVWNGLKERWTGRPMP